MVMISNPVRRAVQVCNRVTYNQEILDFDLNTICASTQAPKEEVQKELITAGIHVVDYETPKFSPYKLVAKKDAEGISRAASFSPFQK